MSTFLRSLVATALLAPMMLTATPSTSWAADPLTNEQQVALAVAKVQQSANINAATTLLNAATTAGGAHPNAQQKKNIENAQKALDAANLVMDKLEKLLNPEGN